MFFYKIFLLSNTNIAMILGIPFLAFTNINILLAEWEFIWWSYILAKTLWTIKQVKLINYNIMTMWSSYVIYLNYIAHDLVIWPQYYPYFQLNLCLSSNLFILFNFTKLLLKLQFYDVNAYLWFAFSEKYDSNFLRKMSILALETIDLCKVYLIKCSLQ